MATTTTRLSHSSESITTGTTPTPLSGYASVEAAIAAIEAASGKAVFEDFRGNADDKPLRLQLGASLVGAAAVTATEVLYLVTPTELGSPSSGRTEGICLEKIGSCTWTASANAVPTAVGGIATEKWASGVLLTDDGLMLARTARAMSQMNREPASIEIVDLGEAWGVLRVVAKGTATSVKTMSRKWR